MVKDLETKFKYPIAGSLRIGEKNEKNIPQRLNYFTVHEDSHTIPNVVEQFKSKYDMDEAYLLDTGWEKTEDSDSVKKEDK